MKRSDHNQRHSAHSRSWEDSSYNNASTIQSSSPSIAFQGRELIPPQSALARAVMGNTTSSDPPEPHTASVPTETRQDEQPSSQQPQRPMSNLSVLMNMHGEMQQQQQANSQSAARRPVTLSSSADEASPTAPAVLADSPDEADSASGPPPEGAASHPLGSSAPSLIEAPQQRQHHRRAGTAPVPPSLARHFSSGIVAGALSPHGGVVDENNVRRCISSRELGTLAPPSGSPYATMLSRKEELELSMRQRLLSMRQTAAVAATDGESSSTGSSRLRGGNESRNRRRAEHNQAIVNDLCEVVADLFIAESKLLKPVTYGVPEHASSEFQRSQLIKSIRNFVSALPNRYALGADTPSEVLLHMRLMAAARSDKTRVAVHIHNMEDDNHWSRISQQKSQRHLRLVTLCCNDAVGLLEFVTKWLATGGSRVLDADVMLSTDGIVLDRFVVEMSGRLRLDMLSNLIEAFLESAESSDEKVVEGTSPSSKSTSSIEPSGPIYYHPPSANEAECHTPQSIREEIQSGIPLTEVLASSSSAASLSTPVLPKIRRMHSMPPSSNADAPGLPSVRLSMRRESDSGVVVQPPAADQEGNAAQEPQADTRPTRERRPLVNRRASADLDRVGLEEEEEVPVLDYITIPSADHVGDGVVNRVIPLVPFDELMLIETLGSGRVSTIYRAAWQRGLSSTTERRVPVAVQMVALKVAMTNNLTGDSSNVDELRREADIAARLEHPNICDLVGVAADSECFCLAYDFCEGGSLLSLLSDASRYYEYLPIALDIANGMAYLHSRNVIHRDLKPSNILLTRDHRAKIADFGMSVANAGQELTAETGTYRYMAPEVIRHESYSSNADVYSFGLCLWQLITREVPFATMTPIQAAYAVAEGRRPAIPESAPRRLKEIVAACWDQDSHKRPSFTYIAMALADYAKLAFSHHNVGAQTLQIANEMLATVEGNSTVNVDFTTPVESAAPSSSYMFNNSHSDSMHSDVGLEIE